MFSPISSIAGSPRGESPPSFFVPESPPQPIEFYDEPDVNNTLDDDILPTTEDFQPVVTTETQTIIIIPEERPRGLSAWLDYMNRNRRQETLLERLRSIMF